MTSARANILTGRLTARHMAARCFLKSSFPHDAPEHFYTYDDDGGRFADRSTLWNGAEASEKTKAGAYKKSAAIARDTVGALPYELTHEEREGLVRDFARWMVARYGTGVDASIHAPDEKGDGRNWHVHFLQTTRTVGKDGFGGKAELELDGKTKAKLGYATGKDQIREMRTRWADHVNAALEKAGHEARVTEKSFKDQGVEQIPTIHLGATATKMERDYQEKLAKGEKPKEEERSDRGKINSAIEAANECKVIDLAIEREKRRMAKEAEAKQHWQIDRLQAEKAEAQRQMEARQTWLFKWVFRGRLREAENDYEAKSRTLERAQKGYQADLKALDNPDRQRDQQRTEPLREQFAQRQRDTAPAQRPEAERSTGRDSPVPPPDKTASGRTDRQRAALEALNAAMDKDKEPLSQTDLKAAYERAREQAANDKTRDVSRAWGRAAKEHDHGKDHDHGLER